MGRLVSQRPRAVAGRAVPRARWSRPATRPIELGPYGYLPNDPAELQEALERTDLTVLAGTVFSHLHQPGLVGLHLEAGDRRGRADQGGRRRAHRGHPRAVARPQDRAPKEEPDLTDEQWDLLTTQTDELGRRILEEYGLHVQFHSHADSHVGYQPEIERFLEARTPST